jgi:hypothetical protein
VLWIGGAIFQVLPGQNSGSDVAGLLNTSAGAAPHWLAGIDTSVARSAGRNGTLTVTAIAVIEYLVGVGAFSPRTRSWALATGLVLSIAILVFGQDLGQLYSGRATDPNSAPLIALMAAVLLTQPRNYRHGEVRRGRGGWHRVLPHLDGLRQ